MNLEYLYEHIMFDHEDYEHDSSFKVQEFIEKYKDRIPKRYFCRKKIKL